MTNTNSKAPVAKAKAKAKAPKAPSAAMIADVRRTAYDLGVATYDFVRAREAAVLALKAAGVAVETDDVKHSYWFAYAAGYMARRGKYSEASYEKAAAAHADSNRSDEWRKALRVASKSWERVRKAAGVATAETRGGKRAPKAPVAKAPVVDAKAKAAEAIAAVLTAPKARTVPTVVTPVDAAKWLRETFAAVDAFVATNKSVLPADAMALVADFRTRLLAIIK